MGGRPGGIDGKRAKKGADLRERIELHALRTADGCLVWTAAKDANGYGRISVDGKTRYAHRVLFELTIGPIPEGRQLDHLCRNRACIDPLHLEAVTARVNVRRGTSPGARALRRERCLYGHLYSEHGVINSGRRVCSECNRVYSRLRKRVPYVVAMRRKRLGIPVVDMAAHFGIDQTGRAS